MNDLSDRTRKDVRRIGGQSMVEYFIIAGFGIVLAVSLMGDDVVGGLMGAIRGNYEAYAYTISLSELPLAGPRPNNTSLRCKRLTDELALRFTTISECISRTASNWKED